MTHHYSNELPASFEETEMANSMRAEIEKKMEGHGHGPFEEFEVSECRHILHEHGAEEIKYIARALHGGGKWVFFCWVWHKHDKSCHLHEAWPGHLSTPLEWKD